MASDLVSLPRRDALWAGAAATGALFMTTSSTSTAHAQAFLTPALAWLALVVAGLLDVAWGSR